MKFSDGLSPLIFSSVEKGVIDLTSWDFLNSDPVNLSGEWSISYSNGEKSLYCSINDIVNINDLND